MSNLEEEKKLLRREMKKLRAARRGNDGAVAENFLSLPETAEKNIFFVYHAFGTEADTMPAIEGLLRAGKTVLLPRVEGKEMSAVPYRADAPLHAGVFGIPEPPGAPFQGKPEVVVLPLLAADERGGRLGYGGGYYDRFLSGMSASDVLKAGYCYDFQVLPEVPVAPCDVPLDVIVTDKRVIRVKKQTEGRNAAPRADKKPSGG